MGVTKTDIFTEDVVRKAGFLKALGHPARLRIIEILLAEKTCICGSLVEELGLAQATISQHLKALKDAGIIQGSIEGTSVCYCLNEPVWNELKALFQHLNQPNPNSSNNCC